MFVDLRDRLRAFGELPELPGGWHAETAVESAYGQSFSGDFVVATRSPDGRWFEVVLVDVSGKGVQAGTRSLLLSGALGGLLGEQEPNRFLTAANNYLLRQKWDEGFATAVHVSIDLATGDYTIGSAIRCPLPSTWFGSEPCSADRVVAGGEVDRQCTAVANPSSQSGGAGSCWRPGGTGWAPARRAGRRARPRGAATGCPPARPCPTRRRARPRTTGRPESGSPRRSRRRTTARTPTRRRSRRASRPAAGQLTERAEPVAQVHEHRLAAAALDTQPRPGPGRRRHDDDDDGQRDEAMICGSWSGCAVGDPLRPRR